jgi:serine phosphatase RsbU (regulator of sigma subunit)
METDSMLVGRATSCDLVLADRYLSRQHARIVRRGDTWAIEDLGSRNGTLLNGQRIEGLRDLSLRDVVQLSASLLTVTEIAGDSATEVASDVVTNGLPSATILRPASDLIAHSEREAAATATRDELRRQASRLRLLNEVHDALSRSIELDELLNLILDSAFKQLQPEEGAVFLKTADGELVRAAIKSTLDGESTNLVSSTLEHEVVDKGQAALVLDTDTDERFGDAQSILSTGVRSLVAAPLIHPEGCLGMIALNSRLHRRQFDEDDLELLASLASVAALRIRNLALAEEAIERRRLEEEISLARQIQIALLPREMPTIPGFEVLGRNLPSRTVSGDFFEIVERKGGKEHILLLADVSGKGVAAAMLTASFEALAAGPIEDGAPPEEICDQVSRRLHRRTPAAKYATAWIGALENETGRLTWSNAGHMPALLIRNDGRIDRLEASGFPIGMLPGGEYKGRVSTLESGDKLVVYTDGLTEAEDPDGEEYGVDRLEETCRKNRGEDLATLAKALEEDLERFTDAAALSDDRTLLLAHRLPS